MKLFRPTLIAGLLYPKAIFRLKTRDKTLCLTFDDGPDPESTPKLLRILDKYKIRAVFFCDGKAAEKYPGLVEAIKDKGHQVGNHGYNHLNGWTSSLKEYCDDVYRASSLTSDKLFRPPYGLLRLNQYLQLRKSYMIMFWDIMPYDFDKNIGADRSLEILNDRLRSGSIIVLHDNHDSSSVLFLDEFLDRSCRSGYTFSHPELK
jgi:peptidoglycan/xylan/chitin deacetylase (PgdA/CDA1 family)